MMGLGHGARIWLACGATDMRRGFDGLAAMVQTQLAADPYSGHFFIFRGRRGNRVKILWWSGDGMNLFAKRLSDGRFVWPQTATGTVALTGAELSMLLEGIDWRRPKRTTLAPIDPDRVVPRRAA
ncbi:MAG: IS66 family insertion sequence element accessory protein TnpB [Terriglobia bacterium]|jgi:transposase|nr:IS66 family insertion sequence element accessory protein TnpB [Terriglobia bacterium]